MPPQLSSPRGRRSASRGRADGNVAAVSPGNTFLRPSLQGMRGSAAPCVAMRGNAVSCVF